MHDKIMQFINSIVNIIYCKRVLTLSRLGGNLPAANISKTIRGMPMEFSQVHRMVKLNVCYNFDVMATNCDVIMTSSVRKIWI